MEDDEGASEEEMRSYLSEGEEEVGFNLVA